jgi:hypothetical protein
MSSSRSLRSDCSASCQTAKTDRAPVRVGNVCAPYGLYPGTQPSTSSHARIIQESIHSPARRLASPATGNRKVQRALMQFFKPGNYFLVREALLKAGRTDLMGHGRDCLIPSKPPRSPSRHVGDGQTTLQKATITIPLPTPPKANRSASAGTAPPNRRATGPAGRLRSGNKGRGGEIRSGPSRSVLDGP